MLITYFHVECSVIKLTAKRCWKRVTDMLYKIPVHQACAGHGAAGQKKSSGKNRTLRAGVPSQRPADFRYVAHVYYCNSISLCPMKNST
jgi:hypothetical protein